MHRMTDEEAWRFLREGNRPAVFSSLRADGRPHAVPTWYAVDGDELLFTTWHTTVKAANLRIDPRVAMVVQDLLNTLNHGVKLSLVNNVSGNHS